MLTAMKPLLLDFPKEKRGLWVQDQIEQYEGVLQEMHRHRLKLVAALKAILVDEGSLEA
jgi:hypothetical protein